MSNITRKVIRNLWKASETNKRFRRWAEDEGWFSKQYYRLKGSFFKRRKNS